MDEQHLSRRERQIMDIIYTRSPTSATNVIEAMPDPPSRAAVRTLLRILEAKGHLTHTKRGKEYVYRPVRPRAQAAHSAMQRVLSTFFDGAVDKAMAALLEASDLKLSSDDLDRLSRLIDKARKDGR